MHALENKQYVNGSRETDSDYRLRVHGLGLTA